MFAKIWSFIMAVIAWVVSLFTPIKVTIPERITIEGVTYRNGFLAEGLRYLNGDKTGSDEVVYRDADGMPYFRLGYEGDFVLRGGSGMWSVPNEMQERIYCREDQWEELRDYYVNPDSFTYCYESVQGSEVNTVALPAVDFDQFEALRIFSEDNAYVDGRNIGKTRRIDKEAWHEPFIRFFKKGNDGIFGVHTRQFFIWEGELVFYRYSNDSAFGFIEVSILPEDLEQYFRELIS